MVTEAEDETRAVMLQLRSAQDASERAELRGYFEEEEETERERTEREQAMLLGDQGNNDNDATGPEDDDELVYHSGGGAGSPGVSEGCATSLLLLKSICSGDERCTIAREPMPMARHTRSKPSVSL